MVRTVLLTKKTAGKKKLKTTNLLIDLMSRFSWLTILIMKGQWDFSIMLAWYLK